MDTPSQTPNSDISAQEAKIKVMIKELSNPDGIKRQQARAHLEEIGGPAIPYLVETLRHGDDHARWEAAKALGGMQAPSTAPALIEALEDNRPGVRWLASEGLIALGKFALIPLLTALTKNLDSVWLREGAHHILHTLDSRRHLPAEVRPVLTALEGVEPAIAVPWAAEKALEAME